MEKKYLIITIILILVTLTVAAVLIFTSDKEDTPKINYVATGDDCDRVQVTCIPGYQRFDDEIGCGCEAKPK